MQTAGIEPAVCWFSPPQRCKTQGGSSHKTDAKRKFVTTRYCHDDDGEMEATLPTACAHGGDGRSCQIRRHEKRQRVFGPGYPLQVVVCVTHEVCFTLYPYGWTPWGRKPVLAMEGRRAAWHKTIFCAAIAAARGQLWPEKPDTEDGSWQRASTQRRQIMHAGYVLGLWGPQTQRDDALDELGVSLTEHRRAHDEWARADDRQTRAQAICRLLEAIPLHLGLFAGLLRRVSAPNQIVYMADANGVLSRISRARNA